jgi:hypothetical protein
MLDLTLAVCEQYNKYKHENIVVVEIGTKKDIRAY